MERYYYHGIETFLDDEASCLEMMIDIIKSGAIQLDKKCKITKYGVKN